MEPNRVAVTAKGVSFAKKPTYAYRHWGRGDAPYKGWTWHPNGKKWRKGIWDDRFWSLMRLVYGYQEVQDRQTRIKTYIQVIHASKEETDNYVTPGVYVFTNGVVLVSKWGSVDLYEGESVRTGLQPPRQEATLPEEPEDA